MDIGLSVPVFLSKLFLPNSEGDQDIKPISCCHVLPDMCANQATNLNIGQGQGWEVKLDNETKLQSRIYIPML